MVSIKRAADSQVNLSNFMNMEYQVHYEKVDF